MSDDRYQQGQPPSNGSGGDFEEGEKTQMVDLDSLRGDGDEPQFAPPPTMSSMPSDPPPDDGSNEFDAGDKTELFEIPASHSPPPSAPGSSSGPDGSSGITSSAPDYDDSLATQPQHPSTPPPSMGGGGPSSPPPPNFGDASSDQQGPSSGQVIIGGDSDDAGHDGATAFINVNDFAEKKAHFTPEQQEAGYDGSTQFVDVNALQAGGPQSNADPIDGDKDLHRGYQFNAADIDRGDITTIRAQNSLGKPVILKRVWDGQPHEMSTPLRERIAQLHEFKHPHLVAMNGMFVSDSGMWVELDAPQGQPLSQVLQQQGPVDLDQALSWMEPIAEVLDAVHHQQLAYANLTPDAVWLRNDGHIQIEPFDMLRLKDRGHLGPFGPPEMKAPPEQRQISPASDVFSLASLTAACLTGLPFEAARLQGDNAPKKAKAILAGLADDPNERPQSAAQFIASLSGGDGLDIKVVGGGIFAALFLGVAILALMGGDSSSDDPPPEQPAQETAQAQGADHDDSAEPAADEGSEGSDPDEADSAGDAEVAAEDLTLPHQVGSDPRILESSGFQQNPPDDIIPMASEEQLQAWRDSFDESIERAEDAQRRSTRREHYIAALESLTRILNHQESPAEEDFELWAEIFSEGVIQDEVEEMLSSTTDSLLDGRLGSAYRRFRPYSRLTPHATDVTVFLDNHSSANIYSLQRIGADSEDDDE